MQQVEAILFDMLKGIVSKPEDIQLHFTDETDEGGEVTVVNVKVDRADIGACIGKKGKNAEAIRTVVGLVGYRLANRRVYVKIDAPRIPKNHFDYSTTDETD